MSTEQRVLEHWGVAWQPKRWLKSLEPPVSVRAASRALAVSDTIIHNWDTANFTPLSAYKALLLRFRAGNRPPKQVPKFVRTDLAFRLSDETWRAAQLFDTRFADLGLPKAPDAPAPAPERVPRPRAVRAAPAVPAAPGVPTPTTTELPIDVEYAALLQALARVVTERDALKVRVAELERDLEALTAPAPAPDAVVPAAPRPALQVPESVTQRRRSSLATRLKQLRTDGLQLVTTPRAEREWRKLEPEVADQFWRVLERLGTGQPVQRKLLEGSLGLDQDRVWSVRASVKHRLLYHQDGGTITVAAFASRGDKEFYRHE